MTKHPGHAPAVAAVLDDPFLNRGMAFTAAERETLGLTGRLPSAVLTLDQQAQRAYRQLQAQPNDLAKNVYLEQLHDRNEVLYYQRARRSPARAAADRLRPDGRGTRSSSTPTSTAGRGGSSRRSTGRTTSGVSFASLGLGPDDVDLIVCTDAEEILGIGDWGVGGIQIAVGKLAVYTAAAGHRPAPRHPGVAGCRHRQRGTAERPAVPGQPARAGSAAPPTTPSSRSTCETASSLFPNAVLHFEDFGPGNARRILLAYRDKYRIFNDDMQGTGAITLAAALAAVKVTGMPDARAEAGGVRGGHRGGGHRRPDPCRHGPRRGVPRAGHRRRCG